MCFSAQQCAEKYLMTFLITVLSLKRRMIWENLLLQTQGLIRIFIEYSERLTDYPADIRYPLLLKGSTEEETEEVIRMALKIKEFVLERLPLKTQIIRKEKAAVCDF